MKKLLLCFAILLSFQAIAKPLPSQVDIIKNLDNAHQIPSGAWEKTENGHAIVAFNRASIRITTELITVMAGIDAENKNKLYASSFSAISLCVNTLSNSIGMGHNASIRRFIYEIATEAIVKPEEKMTTMMWGYKAYAITKPTSDGLLLFCIL